MCTNAKSLCDLLILITSPAGKRLLIDLQQLRDAFKVREVGEALWILSEKNIQLTD